MRYKRFITCLLAVSVALFGGEISTNEEEVNARTNGIIYALLHFLLK
ncbi:hypothetical protein ACEV6Q_04280 [Enterobacter ludwigii]